MPEPRIRPRTPEDVDPDTRAIFESYLAERGNIPNMFRTLAILPRHLSTLIAHFRTVMGEGTVPRLLKELVSVRVSSLNHCRY